MSDALHTTVIDPSESELAQINAVVEAALMGWNLSPRVKRLVLPSYRYGAADLCHLAFGVARSAVGGPIIGVAAWEVAARSDCPPDRSGLLLHGLYVDPQHQRQGIGSSLLQLANDQAAAKKCDGLLVKAQRDAQGFFETNGFTRLAATDEDRDYSLRYWRPTIGR